MSVVAIVKVSGDTEVFQKALIDRADEFKAIGDRAMGVGAIHHRFAVGDGYVLAVDEWESADQFNAFFGDPKLQEFISTIGADPKPPEIMIAESVPSPDRF